MTGLETTRIADADAGPITEEEWAAHRRDMLQSLPPQLEGKDLPAILLPYQRERVQAVDDYDVVVDEKSRRIGATWGMGAAAVLRAGAQRSAGGMDVLYLAYNLDMTRESSRLRHVARAFMHVAAEVEEFLFEDKDEDGADRFIKAFRITFASGFEIKALSSAPRTLRGRQGLVILDEFAFHDNAAQLLKAAFAFLIWGGKVLVISTHNGADNPFAQLIEEVRSGKRPGKVVRTTFDEAIEQGLYKRICLVRGIEWTPEGEAKWRASIRANYRSDAAEELDCVPAQGSGVYLSSALIETCMTADAKVLRLTFADDFTLKPDAYRTDYVDDWLEENVAPELKRLDERLRHSYGFDFGRTGHLSVYLPLAEGRDLVLRAPFMIELRKVPFRQQEQLCKYVTKRLPRFANGKHDARGNGQYVAERMQQEFGATRIEAVMLSNAWYLENSPKLKTRFEERTIELPRDADVKADFRALKMVRGIAKVPDTAETDGADGGKRHGDSAIAGMLAVAAAEADVIEYGYRAVPSDRGGSGARPGGFDRPNHDDDDRPNRGWWRSPLGAMIRGRV
ncbi:terminase large subunit domain-containing protein [Methyloceanibacter stevinii]|uniref:terminase large subunit domain-containing protein n=1 Tax=Methyloceanibacter stevinii TaxID=1774970 RepID=UPI000849E294|nr:terminase family protein [Methyloceanibacter stevinii]